MSSENETIQISSSEIVKRLKITQSINSEMKNNLIMMAEQFHCLDRVAKSVGLLKKNFSFSNRVAWHDILSKLENLGKEPDDTDVSHVAEKLTAATAELENQLIPHLQKTRNNWMLKVFMLDIFILFLFASFIVGAAYIQGLWDFSSFKVSVQMLIYERPVFSLIIAGAFVVSFIALHFYFRSSIARHIIHKLEKETSEFDLVAAFEKNTGIFHSIFRPDIVGLSWFSRRCLMKKEPVQEAGS